MVPGRWFDELLQAFGLPPAPPQAPTTLRVRGMRMDLELQPHEDLLSVRMLVGQALHTRRQPLMLALLLSNLIIAEQGPCHVALDPLEDRLALCLHLPASGLDAQALRALLVQLAERGRQLQEQLVAEQLVVGAEGSRT